MKINQYLKNPAGKGVSTLMPEAAIAKLNEQFEEVRSKMVLKIYQGRQEKLLWFYVTIPDRSVDGLTYQVLIEVDMTTVPERALTVGEAEFKCFSNSPSFVYTYAYVFKRKGYLINWLAQKLGAAVTTKPATRNPNNVIGFERSIYLALKMMQSEGKYSLSYIRNAKVPLDNPKDDLGRMILSVDELNRLRDKRKEELKRLKQAEEKVDQKVSRDTEKKPASYPSYTKGGSNKTKSIKSTPSTPTMKREKSTAKTKSTKKMKKI